MADVAKLIVYAVKEVRNVAKGLKENDRQATRLVRRVAAIEGPVLDVKEGSKKSSSESLGQLLETVREIHKFLEKYVEMGNLKRAMKRRSNAEEISWLGDMLNDGRDALQLKVSVDVWVSEDAADRLEDIENLVDVLEKMKRTRSDDYNQIMNTLDVLRVDERAELTAWVEIDYGQALDFAGSVPLGTGSFGRVFTAKWKTTKTEVAVKHLLTSDLQRDAVRALREEIRIHSSLQFQFVVQFFAASTIRPHLCLVVELAERGSLQQYLRSKCEPLAHALQAAFLFDIARGMKYLHSKGVLHRDLKSANVLMFANDRLKLCDFGLSKVKTDISSTSTRGAVGSTQWMSPEEMDAQSPATEQTDVYSFGVVCFEVAAVTEPFKGMNATQVIRAVVDKEERPEMPAHLSPSPRVVALMGKCWRQNPAQRPQGFKPIQDMLEVEVARDGDPRNRGAAGVVVTSSPSLEKSSAMATMATLSLADRDVLLVLYRSTGGATWWISTNWGTDSDVSLWYGVKANDEGRVVGLNLRGNNLRGPIPPELGNLSALHKLHLYDNQLRGPIPPSLGNMTALQELHLHNNQLSGIPRGAAETFKLMPQRVAISLHGNPWQTPSWAVIQGGWDQIISFYESLSQSGGEVLPSLKVALVGAVRAGKTTLATRLLGAPALRSRTRGVDVHNQPWIHVTSRLELAIWDFAGDHAYDLIHQLFLTDGALHLLVVDLHKFNRDPLSRGSAVYNWLDSLLRRVPDSAVLVVGTHVDAFGDDHEQSAALKDLEVAISKHLEAKKKEWEYARKYIERSSQTRFVPIGGDYRASSPTSQTRNIPTGGDFLSRASIDRSKPGPPSLRLCGVVAFSGRSFDDVTALKDKISEATNDPTMFLDVRQMVPNTWRRVWAVIDALRMGADVESAVRLEDVDNVLERRAEHEFVTQEHALEVWSRAYRESAVQWGITMEDSEQIHLASSRQFQAAIDLRQRGGSVLAACGLIHLTPSWINDLLQALLDHRIDDPKEAQWWRQQLMAYSTEHQMRFNRLVETHRRFALTGLLTAEYLGFLWRDIVQGVDEVVFERLVETMAVHGAIFPCGDSVIEGGAREFMVPARLPGSVASASLAKLERAVSRGIRMQFVIEIYADYIPPAIIAQFLGAYGRNGVGIFRDLVFHACWTRGVSFEVAGRECLIRLGEDLVRLDKGSTKTRRVIEVSIGGPSRTDVFDVGMEIKRNVEELLKERYPGLLFASMNPTFMGGTNAWQDSLDAMQRDLLDKLNENLEGVLSQINDSVGAPDFGTDEALLKQLSSLRSDMQRDVTLQLGSNAQKIAVSVEESIQKSLSRTGSGHDGLDRRILTSVARDVAFLRWPIPCLVCVLPAPERGQEPLAEIDRSFEKWSAVLDYWCRDVKRNRMGVATRNLRAFFLCPQDMSLAECGPNGQGYEVKELLNWAKKAKPMAKVGLALASITLKVCIGLAIPTADFEAALGTKAGGALSEHVEEALNSKIDVMASIAGEGLEADGPVVQFHNAGAHGPRVRKVRPKPLQGFAYDQLKDVIRAFEADGMKRKSPFPSFETAMQFVDRGGRGVEWTWVRTRNIDQFVSS